jgi:hypothetical protein
MKSRKHGGFSAKLPGSAGFDRVDPSEGPIRRTREGGVLTVKIRQPSHEFTFGVGISFIPYPLVLTPVV